MVKTTKKAADEEQDVPLLTPPKAGEELFEGQGKSYEVTKDVNPGQLIEEVYARLGDRNKYQVVAHLEDDDNPVSESNPLTLHMLGDIDLRTVRGVVETHEKDEFFGMTEEEKNLGELKERLLNGEDLPAADVNTLLRSILTNS